MDIPRPEQRRRRRVRLWIIGSGVGLLLALATVGLAKLEPAPLSVSRASIWTEPVHEGEMLLQVRGTGTLVPREIRWIAAQTDARVDRIVVRPGAKVEPGTVLVEMSNADLAQETEAARYSLKAAEADLAEMQLRLKSEQLDQRARREIVENHGGTITLGNRAGARGCVARVTLPMQPNCHGTAKGAEHIGPRNS